MGRQTAAGWDDMGIRTREARRVKPLAQETPRDADGSPRSRTSVAFSACPMAAGGYSRSACAITV